jgi:hypothetical protein
MPTPPSSLLFADFVRVHESFLIQRDSVLSAHHACPVCSIVTCSDTPDPPAETDIAPLLPPDCQVTKLAVAGLTFGSRHGKRPSQVAPAALEEAARNAAVAAGKEWIPARPSMMEPEYPMDTGGMSLQQILAALAHRKAQRDSDVESLPPFVSPSVKLGAGQHAVNARADVNPSSAPCPAAAKSPQKRDAETACFAPAGPSPPDSSAQCAHKRGRVTGVLSLV